jgi:hypothetical protein
VRCISAWDLNWHTLTGLLRGGSHTPTALSISLLILYRRYMFAYTVHTLSQRRRFCLVADISRQDSFLLVFLDSRYYEAVHTLRYAVVSYMVGHMYFEHGGKSRWAICTMSFRKDRWWVELDEWLQS